MPGRSSGRVALGGWAEPLLRQKWRPLRGPVPTPCSRGQPEPWGGVVRSLATCRPGPPGAVGEQTGGGWFPCLPSERSLLVGKGFSAPLVSKAVLGLCQLITKRRARGRKWEDVPWALSQPVTFPDSRSSFLLTPLHSPSRVFPARPPLLPILSGWRRL